MKWLIFGYFFLLFLILGILLFLKYKKVKFCNEVFLWIFCFFNVFFLFGIFFSYQMISNSEFLLNKEYENLFFTHESVLAASSLLQKSYEKMNEEILNLKQEVDGLEQNKENILKEIQILQNRYSLLIQDKKNTNNSVSSIDVQIPDFPTYNQKKYYPNGCESISLYLLLKYQGVDVTPERVVSLLKKGETPHREGNVKYGGDPEVEFVGNPKDQSGYGVFENPIIDVANQIKPGIKKITGTSLDGVLEIVKSGRPVQVWASSYQRTPTKCNTWIHKESGKTITWYCNFHSLVVVGYNSNKVIVSDPLTGTIVKYDRNRFETAYNFYGRRAIYYE